MPLNPVFNMVRGGKSPLALVALLALSGCDGATFPPVAMFGLGSGLKPSDAAAVDSLAPQGVVQSGLIDDLRARRTVLPSDGPYADVAERVIAASSGVAVAELRVARLKAEAKSKNWLPSIGPQVDLTSLGSIITSLVVEQALFDNGRRKAERAFAAADVEVAAVTLTADMNHRVFEGLSHYLDAERAREQAAIASRGVDRLAEFNRIIAVRVDGGVSDRSEQRIIQQRFTEMQATYGSDLAARDAALAELDAMSDGPLDRLSGMSALMIENANAEPLSVVMTRGEGARAVAEAKAAKASLLPGLSASAVLNGDGGVDTGLRAGGGLLNLGLGANVAALDAQADLSDRRTAEAAEKANRTEVALLREIAALQLRETDGAEVLRQTGGNLDMFTEQYKVGRRSLNDLVGQYDSFARMERDQAALKYEIAIRQLQIARDRGQLVDGTRL
jgi:outer membrane protein, adhesin transport system